MRVFDFTVHSSILEKIIHMSLVTYLFLLIFPHVTTLREIAFWTASFCWLVLRLKRQESFINLNPIRIFSNRVNPIIVSLSLFLVIAFISSVFGMEPFENLKRFKGELLIPFLLFSITATEFGNIDKVRKLLFAPVVAFAIYTLLAIIESTSYGLQYFWDKTNREQYLWLANYSQMATIIFPLILGIFLLITNRWLKYSLMSFAVLVLIILTAYRSFTMFLSAISILLLWIIFVKPKKYRKWMLVFISVFLFLFGLLLFTQKENPAIIEYGNKLKKIINISGELKAEGGFSNRMPAWKAAIDVIKDKPILGYGWGMKKYNRIVHQEKFMERWKMQDPYVYDFYANSFKAILFTPHNLFLEITVQSGLIGLVMFITFIGIYLYSLIKNILHNVSETEHNFSIILIGGVFLSFMIMNLMSNELGNVSGKILFAVLGVGAAWMKGEPRQKA